MSKPTLQGPNSGYISAIALNDAQMTYECDCVLRNKLKHMADKNQADKILSASRHGKGAKEMGIRPFSWRTQWTAPPWPRP